MPLRLLVPVVLQIAGIAVLSGVAAVATGGVSIPYDLVIGGLTFAVGLGIQNALSDVDIKRSAFRTSTHAYITRIMVAEIGKKVGVDTEKIEEQLAAELGYK